MNVDAACLLFNGTCTGVIGGRTGTGGEVTCSRSEMLL